MSRKAMRKWISKGLLLLFCVPPFIAESVFQFSFTCWPTAGEKESHRSYESESECPRPLGFLTLVLLVSLFRNIQGAKI